MRVGVVASNSVGASGVDAPRFCVVMLLTVALCCSAVWVAQVILGGVRVAGVWVLELCCALVPPLVWSLLSGHGISLPPLLSILLTSIRAPSQISSL